MLRAGGEIDVKAATVVRPASVYAMKIPVNDNMASTMNP
jgi:hypothetical protein